MVKKYCPQCGQFSYSSAPENKWVCPICGEDLTKDKAQLLGIADLQRNTDMDTDIIKLLNRPLFKAH